MAHHCCNQMDYHINEREKLIYYDKIRNFYALNFSKSTIQTIKYCPWCAFELPNLYDEWFNILEEEYGIEGPLDDAEKHKIPQEFKTDEWWRKRGL